MTAPADLVDEQRYLEHAYACLERMRGHAGRTLQVGEELARAEKTVDATIVQWHLERRVAALAETPAALCFGRLDHDAGERLYVGRRHVEDATGDAVVVDWRARASTPFYRATFADPMGLDRRRRFSVDGRTLLGIFDEDFTDPETSGGGGVPDPLLAELERARTGEMRDIVATIQAEQDIVIRAPIEDLVVVQGGPGTGKTAVGLHRAAFLLYEHRERLERQRVLVVGPNPIFLRYISQVLPSLGETAVVQATIEGLMAGRYPVRAVEEPAASRVKGDARMAEVLRRAVRERINPPTDDVVIPTTFGSVRLPAAEVAQLMETALGRKLATNAAREVVREQLVRLTWRRHADRETTDLAIEPAFTAALRTSREFKATLDRLWPSLAAPLVVRATLGNRRTLARVAGDLLSDDEQRLVVRRMAPRVSQEHWTRGDLALLDEAEALVSGPAATYGHVVADEAQDLSAMELRMLARRTPDRSMTVLGDLAQATSPACQVRWDDAVTHLSAPDARIEELLLGYRVPGPVLDFANRLLPLVAPHVQPSRSVRTGGDPPLLVATDTDGLTGAVVTEVTALAGRWASVGVVAPTSLLQPLSDALADAGISIAEGIDGEVSLLAPADAKGLEFDAVVVVEPARFLAEDVNGARLLYVALTRAVQHLGVVHAEPLPEPLLP